jgi:two-component system sensor histidine kinase RegB
MATQMLLDENRLLPRRSVRLDTLVRLRWLAVLGQTTAVLIVYFGLQFPLPIGPCLAIIAVSAWINVALRLRYPMTKRLEPQAAAWMLAYDIAQHAALLFLTGGLQNPFAFLLLAPVIIAATVLSPRRTLILGAFSMTCASALFFIHYPLPWESGEALILPPLYTLGLWLAILLSMVFLGVYAWQVSEEAQQLTEALAATELVLAREQHLSQLDGLAAAAAHELGTPLGTITLVVKELQKALPADSPHTDDVRLLREQAQRCRDILGKLSQLSSGGAPFDMLPVSSLIEEVVAPHRDFGIDIVVDVPRPVAADPVTRQPVTERNPGMLYGLGNLVENAVDFARRRVEITARWTEHEVLIVIQDDGPGFAPEIMERIGEPYVTSSRIARGRKNADSDVPGLGLGFFIAKTLLERSGADLTFENRMSPASGAVIRVTWSRDSFEPKPANAPKEAPATSAMDLAERAVTPS